MIAVRTARNVKVNNPTITLHCGLGDHGAPFCNFRLFGGLAFFGAAVGLEDSLAHAQGFWGDLDQFVVGDEFDRLLEREVAERDEADGFV